MIIAVLKVCNEIKINKSCQIKSVSVNILIDCKYLGYQFIARNKEVLANVTNFQTGYND